MKTLHISQEGSVVFDNEENKLYPIYSTPDRISKMYLIKEPMNVAWSNDGEYYTKSAEAGDLVIMFYTEAYKNRIVVVKCPEWTENINLYEEEEQKRKLEWAAAQDKESDAKCVPC